MARSEGSTALLDGSEAFEPEVSANGNGNGTEAADKVYGPDDLVGVMIRVPFALRQMVEQTADEQTPKVSVPQIVVRMIADAYGYKLPEAARKSRAKYANEEDKKAAIKAARDKQRNTVKAVLLAVEQGKIQGIDLDALVAELQAKEAAALAAKEAEAEAETAAATS